MTINDKFNQLFDNMAEGVALHHYIRDDKGVIVNYLIDDVNPAFEKIVKIKKAKVAGKLVTDVYGVSEPPYLNEYKNIKKGESLKFEVFFPPLKKHFSISASSWGDDGFAAIFFDISERKKFENDLEEKNKNLEKINSLMVDRELKMIELKNDLKKYEDIKTTP